MIRSLVAIVISLITIVVTVEVQAAQLTDIQGAVLVDSGHGFEQVTGSFILSPGDRVKAVGGAVKIVYSNGAIQWLASGETTTVLVNPPPPVNPEWDILAEPYMVSGLLIGSGFGLAAVLSNNAPASP